MVDSSLRICKSGYLFVDNVFKTGSADGVNVMESGSVVLTRYITAGEVVTLPVYATDQGLIPGPLTSKPFYVSVFATVIFYYVKLLLSLGQLILILRIADLMPSLAIRHTD